MREWNQIIDSEGIKYWSIFHETKRNEEGIEYYPMKSKKPKPN